VSAIAHNDRHGWRQPTQPFWAVLAVTVLAKAAALLPGFAMDDWGAITEGTKGLEQDVLGKARWGHWLMLKAADLLQIHFEDARILWVGAAILAYAAFGWAVVRFWGCEERNWLTVLAAAIIVNHPYTAEIFSFRIGLPPAAAVAALLTLLLHLAARPPGGIWGGAMTFALAVSCYPIAFHYALMVAVVGAAVVLGRALIAPRGDPARLLRPALRPVLRLSLFIAVGTLVYCLIMAVVGRLLHVWSGYFTFLPVADLPGRLIIAVRRIGAQFLGTNPLVPVAVRGMLGATVLLLLAGAARARPWRTGRLALAFGCLCLLGAALMWSLGIPLVLERLWLPLRSMAHVGVFWAGCCLLAVELNAKPWVTRTVTVLSALTVLSFIGVNQQVFEDQRRLNARDLAMANRIVGRLEVLPGFDKTMPVVFVGGQSWAGGRVATSWGDLNISAYRATWSQRPLLNEVSGLALRSPEDAERETAAEKYCATVEPWPAVHGVTVRDGLAIVCLDKPGAK
jgi:hypothetical protein